MPAASPTASEARFARLSTLVENRRITKRPRQPLGLFRFSGLAWTSCAHWNAKEVTRPRRRVRASAILVRTIELEIDTHGRELIDLTDDVRGFCTGANDGYLNVFVPHATAGLAILELGDNSEPDLDELLERLLPKDARYHHHHGSAGHGADHLLPVLLSPSLVVPVVDGVPQLGTWQHVVLVDRNPDNPNRRVRLSLLEA